jgi:hypothetical protein
VHRRRVCFGKHGDSGDAQPPAVRITRTAISPRLATSSLRKSGEEVLDAAAKGDAEKARVESGGTAAAASRSSKPTLRRRMAAIAGQCQEGGRVAVECSALHRKGRRGT